MRFMLSSSVLSGPTRKLGSWAVRWHYREGGRTMGLVRRVIWAVSSRIEAARRTKLKPCSGQTRSPGARTYR